MEFVLKEVLILINRLLYCSALLPLAVKNYRLKTSRGLSDGLVWCLFNGYITLSIFSFSLKLPTAYGVISSVQLAIMCFIIGQRFWYDDFAWRWRLACLYATNAIVGLAFALAATVWPYQIGHALGWASLFFFVSTRIPQIIKIQRERSVYGFSYGFSVILAVAAVLEVSLVFAYNLPLQMLATSIWSITAFFIFTAQFYFFLWRKQ